MGVLDQLGLNNFLTSGIFWVLTIILLACLALGGVYYFHRRKFIFPTYELINSGENKTIIRVTKAGFFKDKSTFFGWVDYGRNEVLKVRDGRKILGFTSEDYHQTYKGKRCLIVTSDTHDRRVLVPIDKVNFEGSQMFANLPSMEIQEAAVDSVKQAEKEMKPLGEAVMQMIIVGFIIIGALIAIVLVTRFAQGSITEASAIAVSNSQVCAEVCSQAVVKGVEQIVSQSGVTAP